ncbi:hypothetical protein [Brevundimonas balnearis]|uniref:DJ-1/PfpI domain-containing protein n=1 Tax=Brevundimonas balnearis TaxID=1572858 RepID=A0ABV6QZ91_9CAUL
MRRSMNFGALGDVERVMQGEGLSLAPIATSDASMAIGGISVIPTATVGDIVEGRLAALVIPGGAPDADSEGRTAELVAAARARNLPILAFGEGVAQVARAMEVDPAGLSDFPGVVFSNADVFPIRDEEQLGTAAAAIG